MTKHGPDFTTKPTLTAGPIQLRPFAEADFQELLAIISEPTVQRLTGSSATTVQAQQPFTPERLQATIDWYASRNTQTDRLDLAIHSHDLGKVVGEVVLNEWDPDNQSANFRILIGEAGRNRGFGSLATQLIVTYAFEYLQLHRLELEVFAFNPRARHVYQKAGFIYEGRRREAFNFDEQWVDSELYAILASDYFATKRTT